MAFISATILGGVIMAASEDVLASGSNSPAWSLWPPHPFSILVGTLAFLGLLYLLQLMNDREHAVQYLQPYTPLLVCSGANLALKLNAAWIVAVTLGCVVWSIAQVHQLRSRRPTPRGASVEK